jgi:hypothetical protein
VILLTKVDKMGLEDPKDLFHSKTVLDACKSAGEVLGLPLNNIFPMINYAGTIYPDDFRNFLALHNLWQIMMKANDFIENNTTEGFRD